MVIISLSVFLGVRVQRFFRFWLLLEINMLRFLGTLRLVKSRGAVGPPTKYFMVQALSSSLFLGVCFTLCPHSIVWSRRILVALLLLKLGSVPFHQWYVRVVDSVSWEVIFLLSTIQKVLPLWLMFHFSVFRVLGLIVLIRGVRLWGAVNQVALKKILAYSSLFRLMWVFSVWGAVLLSFKYFLFYRISLLIIILRVKSIVWSTLSDVKDGRGPLSLRGLLFIGLFNLRGIPPFVMFYLKVEILKELVANGRAISAFVVRLRAVAFIFIYIKLFLSSVGGEATGRVLVLSRQNSLVLGGGVIVLLRGLGVVRT